MQNKLKDSYRFGRNSKTLQTIVTFLVFLFLYKWGLTKITFTVFHPSELFWKAWTPFFWIFSLGFAIWTVIFVRSNGEQKRGPQAPSHTEFTGRKITSTVFQIPTANRYLPNINITSPQEGIFIAGAPGSGKSFSIIEPIINQAVRQKFTGVLYDFKFPTLLNVALGAYGEGARPFWVVNLTDMSRTHRVNPISAKLVKTPNHAEQIAHLILQNLDKTLRNQQNSNFFTESAKLYLKAVIWYLRQEYPHYCTLPHVISMCNEPVEDVLAMLARNDDTRAYTQAMRGALQKGANNQLQGVVSTLQNNMSKLYTDEIFWVFSGNDFSLNLNHPDTPGFLILGNNDEISDVASPVLSLVLSVAIKQMNQQNRLQSAIILDEAPTLFVPGLDGLPGTGRANGISTVIGVQSIAQLIRDYGQQNAEVLMGNLRNKFFGGTSEKSAATLVVDLWGKEEVLRTSYSTNRNRQDGFDGGGSRSEGSSQSWQERNRVQPQDINALQRGEFFGMLAASDVSTFKADLRPNETPKANLSAFANAPSYEDLRRNRAYIDAEARQIIIGPEPEQKVRELPSPKPTSTRNYNSDLEDDF